MVQLDKRSHSVGAQGWHGGEAIFSRQESCSIKLDNEACFAHQFCFELSLYLNTIASVGECVRVSGCAGHTDDGSQNYV